MFQTVSADLLNKLGIPLPELDGITNPEHPVFSGNFGGTEATPRFFAQSVTSGLGFKSIGCFVGTPHIPSFKQVTDKLFTYKLKVYSRGYNEYNLMWLDCKAAGKTAQTIATINSPNQVIAIMGELDVVNFTSKTTNENVTKLELFTFNMNFAGEKAARNGNAYPTSQPATNSVVPTAFVASVDFDEIAF